MVSGFALFVAMASQWRWVGAGMAGAFKSGLDYNALESTARALSIEITPSVFSDVRTLEAEALTVWSRKR